VAGQQGSHTKPIGVGLVCGCQQVLPTAVQTQAQQSSPERPPLPPEGLNTGEVLRRREGVTVIVSNGFRGETARRITIQGLSRQFHPTEY